MPREQLELRDAKKRKIHSFEMDLKKRQNKLEHEYFTLGVKGLLL